MATKKETSIAQRILNSDIDDIFGQQPMSHDELQKLSQKLNALQIEVKKRSFHQIVKPIKKFSLSKVCSFWFRNPESSTEQKSNIDNEINDIEIKKELKTKQNIESKPKSKKEIMELERNRMMIWMETKREKEEKLKQEMEKINKLIKKREITKEKNLKKKQKREQDEMKRNEEKESIYCIIPLSLMEIAFKYYKYYDIVCDWRTQEKVLERYTGGYDEVEMYSLWAIYGDGKMYQKLNSDLRIKTNRECLEFVQEFSMKQMETLKTFLICYQLSHKKRRYKFNNYGKQIAEWYSININDYNIDQCESGNELFLFFKQELKVFIPNDFQITIKNGRVF